MILSFKEFILNEIGLMPQDKKEPFSTLGDMRGGTNRINPDGGTSADGTKSVYGSGKQSPFQQIGSIGARGAGNIPNKPKNQPAEVSRMLPGTKKLPLVDDTPGGSFGGGGKGRKNLQWPLQPTAIGSTSSILTKSPVPLEVSPFSGSGKWVPWGTKSKNTN